ncbi:MAG: right-handed parallel beta-helix repeat-containing protein [Candidatus Obscuribacterales bacterium]|nr:right-handed parallel beta-helix repeat-containing protein [Steroidobacteraceae bacterium]
MLQAVSTSTLITYLRRLVIELSAMRRARVIERAMLGGFLLCGAANAATITGTVFEDVNFGGGIGRSQAASAGVALANARVELYRVGTGVFVAAATTNAAGFYTIATTGSAATQALPHYVRVVNGTVRSSRGSGCTTCVPVQTFRTDATLGAATPVTDFVGGQNPALSDAASNTTGANYSTLNTAAQAAQSITTVDPALSTSTVANVNFGFNFDLIVNTRDAASCAPSGSGSTFFPCQGALRQFIINANALTGEGSLAQSGSGQIDGFTTGLPSGSESSIFMVPDGTANAGQNVSYATQLTGGVAVITLSATLTSVTGNNTRLDATTQTFNIDNSNSGTLGSGGTVGVNAISLPTFQRPEVQLSAANSPITLSGSSAHILGFALRQGFIVLSGTSGLARNNLVGMTATGDSSDNTSGIGIAFQGTSATVRNNFVTVNNSGIRTDNGGAGSLITLNEVARPTSGHTLTFDGILLVGTVSNIQVTANFTRDQRGGGIEVGFGGGASATNITVSNNTVVNNGFASAGVPSTEPLGMAAYNFAGSNVVFSRNIVRDNAGAGLMVMLANNTLITQNSFSNNGVLSNNGGLSIDLDTRSVDPNSLGSPQGVTINDFGDGDGGPNRLLNYAVITNAYIIGSELTINGFALPNSAIELYLAQADPTGFGEGLTYLGTLTEGSPGVDLNTASGAYGPALINGIAQGEDNTNQFMFRFSTPGGVAIGSRLSSTATLAGETSEFGGNVLVTGGPSLTHLKSVQVISDPINGATNPKSIPGASQLYALRVSNQGAVGLDNNSVAIVDAVDANTKLFVGDVGAAGSGPIAYSDGAPSSALTWTFTALNSATDDIEFSNDAGTTWTYVPTADVDGCDVAVTHIRLRPKGTMPGNGSGDPYFDLRFRVLVR